MEKVYDPETLAKIQQTELEMLRDFDFLCDKYGIEYFAVGGTTIGCLRHGGFIPWDDDIDLGMVRDDYEKFLSVAEKEFGNKYSILNFETDSTYPLMTTRWVKNGTVFLEECFKHLNCNFGIFLDLYCFDNIPDDNKKMKKQGFWAWFWGKWLILLSVSEPVLYQSGIVQKMILAVCKIVHSCIKILHIKPEFFYKKAQKHIQMYRNQDTKRIAYMFDPKPYMSIMEKEDVFPTYKISYQDEKTKMRVQKRMEKYCRYRFGDYMVMPPEDKRHNHMPYKLDFGE